MRRDCDCGTNLLNPTPGHQLLIQNWHAVRFSIIFCQKGRQRWFATLYFWCVQQHSAGTGPRLAGGRCLRIAPPPPGWESPGYRWWGNWYLNHLENGWVARQREGDQGRPRSTLWKGIPHLCTSFLAALFEDGKGSGDCGEGCVEGQEGVGCERQRGHA